MDYLPKFLPGQAVTFTASAAVTGGRLVQVSGDRTVSPATADSNKVVGIAGYDADESEPVTVYLITGGVHRLTLAATVAAGARLAAATGGKVSGTGTNKIGLALQGGDADDVIDVLTSIDVADVAGS